MSREEFDLGFLSEIPPKPETAAQKTLGKPPDLDFLNLIPPKVGTVGGEIGQVIGRPPRELEKKPGLGYIAKETMKGTAQDIKTALMNLFTQGPSQVFEGVKKAKERIQEPEFWKAITKEPLREINRELKTTLGGVLETVPETAKGLVAFLPQTAKNLVENPRRQIIEDPLGTLFLLGAVGGVASKGLGLKAGMGELLTKEDLGVAFKEASQAIPEFKFDPEIINADVLNRYNAALQKMTETSARQPEQITTWPEMPRVRKAETSPELRKFYEETRAVEEEARKPLSINVKQEADGSLTITQTSPTGPPAKIEGLPTGFDAKGEARLQGASVDRKLPYLKALTEQGWNIEVDPDWKIAKITSKGEPFAGEIKESGGRVVWRASKPAESINVQTKTGRPVELREVQGEIPETLYRGKSEIGEHYRGWKTGIDYVKPVGSEKFYTFRNAEDVSNFEIKKATPPPSPVPVVEAPAPAETPKPIEVSPQPAPKVMPRPIQEPPPVVAQPEILYRKPPEAPKTPAEPVPARAGEAIRGGVASRVAIPEGEKPNIEAKTGEKPPIEEMTPERVKVFEKEIEDRILNRKELTPEQKEYLKKRQVYEEIERPAVEEAPIEEEIPIEEVPKAVPRERLVKVTLKTPSGDFVQEITEASVERLKGYAKKLKIDERVSVGPAYIGKWGETLPPKQIETLLKEVMRDVKTLNPDVWEKHSGYPFWPEIKRVFSKIKLNQRIKRAVKLDEIKKELEKTPEGKVEADYLDDYMKEQRKLPKYAPPNINLERMDAPEVVKKDVFDWGMRNAVEIDKKIPHLTFKEVETEAARQTAKYGTSYETMMKNFKKYFRPTQNKQMMGTLIRLRDTALTIENQVMELKNKLKDVEPKSEEALDIGLKLADLSLTQDGLWEAVSGSARLSGQALSFRRMISKAMKGTYIDKLESINRLFKKRFPDLTDAEYQSFIEGLKKIDLNDPASVIRYIRAAQKPNFWSKLQSWWYNSVLSGVPTHIINTVGNTLFGSVEAFVTRPIATLIDIPLSKVLLRDRTYTGRGALGYYTGMVRGIPMGVRRAFNILKTGFEPEELTSPSKWDQAVISPWKSEAASIAIEAPGRFLKAADALFKGIWEEAKKTELAVNKAYSKGKSIKQIMTEAEQIIQTDPYIIDEASRWGRWQTFNEAPGKFAKWLIKGREIFPPLRPLIPFVNIASNLMRRGNIDYSPAGFIRNIKNPDLAAQYARAALGTGLMATGYLLYQSGNLTLGAPKTAGEKNRFYDIEGKQPWSVKIKDSWLPIRRFEPFCYPFLIGGIIGKQIQDRKLEGKNAEDVIFNAAGEVGRMLINSSYLNTLVNLLEGMAGYREPGEMVKQTMEGTAGGLIPYSSLLRNITQALDPEVKEAKLGTVENLMSNVPELSKKVPARLTQFGEEMERPGGRIRGVLPVVPTEIPKDPVRKELARLEIDIGFPTGTVKGRTLSEDEYRKYKELAGKETETILTRVINHSRYESLSDKAKKDLIAKAINKAREDARLKLLRWLKQETPNIFKAWGEEEESE